MYKYSEVEPMKYAYTNGVLLDGSADMQPQRGMVLRTDGENILDIVPEGTDLTGFEIVDLKGGYLMPGLINLHVHLPASGSPKKQGNPRKLVKFMTSMALTRRIALAMCEGYAKTQLLSGVTTIRTLTEMLSGLGVRVELLSGSLTVKEKNDVRRRAESGEIDVLIGTQALIQKTSAMSSAGLVIVDEQHRFGVSQRSTLAEKGKAPHILAMSATPIPRTLALIIYGDLDVSILGEMPKGRLPVKTYAVDGSFRLRVYNFIKKHIAAGRQAYIVCPLVESSDGKSEKASAIEYYDRLVNGDFRDIPTGLLYGKLKQSEKEQVMSDFKAGKLKLLVSTTVIEVGIDVPNAVVILIENAEQFGLSQLHQLRGRVGRGSEQSFCVLMTDNRSDYTKARMDAMVRTTNGFEIAQEDLELRGPGNFFGREQHGLPPLKVADIADDAGLLTEADRVSAAILSADPQLTRPENELLRRNVERLFGGSGEYGWN